MEIEITSPWRKSGNSNPNGACAEVAAGRWRKSRYSFSNGNCAEVGQESPEGFRKPDGSNASGLRHEDYRKSSHSAGNGECAEVASGVLVRDTKQAHLPDSRRTVLRFSPGAWQDFTSRVKTGNTP